MSNLFPADWDYVAISEVSSVVTKGATPSTYGFDYIESPVVGGARFIRGNNATLQGFFDGKDIKYICKESNDVLKRSKLEIGDVVISIVGSVGASFTVDEKVVPANINQNVALIRPKESLSSKFLGQLIVSNIVQDEIANEVTVQAQPSLSLKQIGDFKIPFPPLPEQKKIAAILTSVDDVIESTQAQINKLKDLKTGMMQELLTKGIGHSEFKDSAAGRIPKAWTTSTIGELAEQVKPGPFGSAITKSIYVESGYKVYGQEQVIAGNMKVGNYYIDKEKFDELSVFKVAAGEILISLVGTFGQVLVVPEEFEEGIINPRLLKLRMPKNKVSPYFIAHQLKSEFVVDQLNKFQQGGTMGVLSGSTLKPVKLVVPPYDEQLKITNILSNFDLNIEAKERKKIQLINSKKALMQDLLTGKVRVKVN